jgi:acyl-CoA thioesterase FadM
VHHEGDEETLAEGYTVHGFVHADSGRPARAPAAFLQAMEDAFKSL